MQLLCFFVQKKVTDMCDTQQIIGGSEHTLRAKLIFSQGSHGMIYQSSMISLNFKYLHAPSNYVCISY